jgi:hypothetical protein
MASPIPGSTLPAMRPKPMQDPGTAPPWLRSSQPPVMPPPTGFGGTISDPGSVFGKPPAPPTNGLAGLGAATQQYGSAATDVETPTANASLPPARQPPTNGGTPWDFGAQRGLRGSKTFDFDWDPDNPMFGGDAQGFMANSTLAAGSRGAALKMALRDASGKELYNNGDGGGGIANLTSGKLAKGRYSLAVDPSDPNAEWHMGTVNARGSNYYKNNGAVSNASAGTGWTPGTDTSGWDRNASAAAWDAGAQGRFDEQNKVNPGYGAALNPNTPGGQGLTVDGRPSGGSLLPPGMELGYGDGASGAATGGNPLQRGAGTPTLPGRDGMAPDGINRLGTDSQGNQIQTMIGAGTGGAGSFAGSGGAFGGPEWTGLNDIDTDFSGAAARGADAAYKGATQFMDGDFSKEREQTRSQLVAQGLQPGTEAFETQMERVERGQNAARTNAAFTAQGVGHSQSGDLLMRALQARKDRVGEQATSAGLGLQGRGQDISRDISHRGMDISDRNTNRGLDLSRDTTGINAELASRRLGLDSDDQDMRHLIQLIAGARGGVNMPNFGAPGSLDVTGAHGIASGNANAAAGRSAANNNMYAQIAAQLFGGIFK